MAILRRPGHVIYSGWDRIAVEVLVDNTWHAGELRAWDLGEDGTWSAIVTWSQSPGMNRLDRFPRPGSPTPQKVCGVRRPTP